MVLAPPFTDKTIARPQGPTPATDASRFAKMLDSVVHIPETTRHSRPPQAMSTQLPVKTSQLALSALGEDKPGIIDELSRCIMNRGCNITDSRMTVLGGDFAILLLIDGNWNTIAKLEDQIAALGERLGLSITTRRTARKAARKDLLPYGVDVVSLDQPGIVHNLASFFSKRQINIQEMSTSSYAATHTGTPMFTIHLTVNIPATLQISLLRDEFMDFCDQLNLDAVIEPVKD